MFCQTYNEFLNCQRELNNRRHRNEVPIPCLLQSKLSVIKSPMQGRTGHIANRVEYRSCRCMAGPLRRGAMRANGWHKENSWLCSDHSQRRTIKRCTEVKSRDAETRADQIRWISHCPISRLLLFQLVIIGQRCWSLPDCCRNVNGARKKRKAPGEMSLPCGKVNSKTRKPPVRAT